MTAPHRALSDLVCGRAVDGIDDEAEFLRSVHEHRMTAAVLAAHQEGAIRLPEGVALTLGVWELAERREHVRFWETIKEVTDRLAPAGVDVAVIKGVATEARWYDEIGQRVATDLDLLLPPTVVDDAAELIALIDPQRGMFSSVDWLTRRRLLQHVDLRVGSVQVDLHFDPLKLGIPTRQLDEIWESTQILEAKHGTIRVLRPEIELVLLLLHLNKDSFAFLGPFLDVRQIVTRANLDWAYLGRFVAGEGLQVPVFKSLATVGDVIGMEFDVPRLRGVRARTWDRLWGDGLILGGYEGRTRAPTAQRFLALHASGRSWDNAREARRQLLPPRQLLEVAGSLAPGGSYARHMFVDRWFRRSRRPSFTQAEPPEDTVTLSLGR